MGSLTHGTLACLLVGLWVSSHGVQTALFAGLGCVVVFGLLLLFGYESLGRRFRKRQTRHRP